MTAKKPVPGILWVNSDVIKLDQLSREDFDTWYSDEHIPDVVATSGVPSASRYQHMADGSTPARRLGFLTIYKMPDINFIETKEFRNLEGQSPGPNRERIFQNAEFDTRVYELVQSDEGKGAASSGRPNLLLFAAMSHSSDSQLDEWYRGEHVDEISKCPGYRRTSRYKLASRSLLSAFERSFPPAPTWLAIHEFDGVELPWKELAATDETDWAKKIIPGISDIDFGCFRLKRAYEEPSVAKL